MNASCPRCAGSGRILHDPGGPFERTDRCNACDPLPAPDPQPAPPLRAFPSNAIHPEFAGMELRDWFAGQALALLPHSGETSLAPDEWASDAYRIADALMVEREKRRG